MFILQMMRQSPELGDFLTSSSEQQNSFLDHLLSLACTLASTSTADNNAVLQELNKIVELVPDAMESSLKEYQCSRRLDSNVSIAPLQALFFSDANVNKTNNTENESDGLCIITTTTSSNDDIRRRRIASAEIQPLKPKSANDLSEICSKIRENMNMKNADFWKMRCDSVRMVRRLVAGDVLEDFREEFIHELKSFPISEQIEDLRSQSEYNFIVS